MERARTMDYFTPHATIFIRQRLFDGGKNITEVLYTGAEGKKRYTGLLGHVKPSFCF